MIKNFILWNVIWILKFIFNEILFIEIFLGSYEVLGCECRGGRIRGCLRDFGEEDF